MSARASLSVSGYNSEFDGGSVFGVEGVSGGDAAWMGCGDEGGGDDQGEDNDGEDKEGEDGKGEGDTERKASGSTTFPRPLLIFVRPAVR